MRHISILVAAAALALSAPSSLADVKADWRICDQKNGESLETAIKGCTRIIESGEVQGEELSDAYVSRGNHYSDLDIRDKAMADFEKAIQLDPDNAYAYYNRGIEYTDREAHDLAIKDYDRAIALEPQFPQAYNNRGLAFIGKGEFERAIADFTKSIAQKNPELHLPYGSRGHAYVRLGRYDEAIADLKKCLSLDPEADWAAALLKEAQAAKSTLDKRGQRAPDTGQGPRSIAMVIGNNEYPFIGSLKNAANDARAVAAALKAKGYSLIGPGGAQAPYTNLTRGQLEEALTGFQKESETASVALIWYAGHGSSFKVGDLQKDNFLLPTDFRTKDSKDILNKGVSVERMKRAALPASALRILIIDACRDNSVEVQSRSLKRGMQPEGRNKDIVIMFSTQAGQTAEDGDGTLSPFAEGFLAELSANPKSPLPVFMISVSGRVKSITKAEQIPEFFTSLTDPKVTLVK